MTDRLDRIEAILEQTARQQQLLTEKVNELTQQQQRSQQWQDNLTSAVTRLSEILTVEVSEFKANFMAVEHRIEQIWQYLLDQFRSRGNGHGEGEDP